MRDRNPLSPWNPGVPAELTPTEFEQTVLAWLQKWGQGRGDRIKAEHLGKVEGTGGEYKIDVLIQIDIVRRSDRGNPSRMQAPATTD